MSHANTEEMMKHVKIYIFVFIALAVLTLVTVWASYLHVDKSWHIAIAMFIATIKGGLVAAFFMHLLTEKKGIHVVLLLTVVFFFALLILTLFTDVTMLRSSFN
jgi:cytochrome c oxidase subunit IV